MSKHVHPAPRATFSTMLKTLVEIITGLSAADGRRVAE